MDPFDRARIKNVVNKILDAQNQIKNNLTADRAPSASDDKNSLYVAGSKWVYDNTTYICVNNTPGEAVWQSESDIVAFDTWTELVAAISESSPSYIGKYALVANANGAPSAGITYIAPAALTDYVADGGSATIKINAQGETYSVTTMPRTVTNPTISNIMRVAALKYTTKGYWVFAVVPTNGLPVGVNLNDIAYYDGANWLLWQRYAAANNSIIVGSTTSSQLVYIKSKGGWICVLNDNSGNGYTDNGNVRTQWGVTNANTINFPAPFKNTSYAVNVTIEWGGWDLYSAYVIGKSNTAFSIREKYQNGSTTGDVNYLVSWIAIGLKP